MPVPLVCFCSEPYGEKFYRLMLRSMRHCFEGGRQVSEYLLQVSILWP